MDSHFLATLIVVLLVAVVIAILVISHVRRQLAAERADNAALRARKVGPDAPASQTVHVVQPARNMKPWRQNALLSKLGSLIMVLSILWFSFAFIGGEWNPREDTLDAAVAGSIFATAIALAVMLVRDYGSTQQALATDPADPPPPAVPLPAVEMLQASHAAEIGRLAEQVAALTAAISAIPTALPALPDDSANGAA